MGQRRSGPALSTTLYPAPGLPQVALLTGVSGAPNTTQSPTFTSIAAGSLCSAASLLIIGGGSGPSGAGVSGVPDTAGSGWSIVVGGTVATGLAVPAACARPGAGSSSPVSDSTAAARQAAESAAAMTKPARVNPAWCG